MCVYAFSPWLRLFGFGIVLQTFLVHSLVKNALYCHGLLRIMCSCSKILIGQLFLYVSLSSYILAVSPEVCVHSYRFVDSLASSDSVVFVDCYQAIVEQLVS